MAGRKASFDRDEQRKNQIVIPMSEREKKRIQDAAHAGSCQCQTAGRKVWIFGKVRLLHYG